MRTLLSILAGVLIAEAPVARPLIDVNVVIPAAAIFISLVTLILSTNDRRRRDDKEELIDLRKKVVNLTADNERIVNERDRFQQQYFTQLEKTAKVNRDRIDSDKLSSRDD